MAAEVLDEAAFERLVAGGQPIKRMREGVKVWRLPDNRIVKLFRPRGRFSRSRLYPANERFAANAQSLAELGFTTVVVQQLFDYPQMGCSGVVYEALPGETLESCLKVMDTSALITQLAALMAQLHAAGVLFRALHLGNVLVMPDARLSLIDVEEVVLSGRTLRPWIRLRNFRHLLRRELDRELLGRDGFQLLVDGYFEGLELPARQQRRLRRGLQALSESSHWPQQPERS